MADPFRLRVLKALSAALAEIEPATDQVYVNDLTPDGEKERVIRGRLAFGSDDPLPMLSIIEPPLAIDQLPQPKDDGGSNGEWELVIQGWVEDDHDHPTDPAHVLMADVKARLAALKEAQEKARRKTGNSAYLLGEKGVTSLQIGAGVVRPADEISSKAYFWLNIVFGVAENASNPYE